MVEEGAPGLALACDLGEDSARFYLVKELLSDEDVIYDGTVVWWALLGFVFLLLAVVEASVGGVGARGRLEPAISDKEFRGFEKSKQEATPEEGGRVLARRKGQVSGGELAVRSRIANSRGHRWVVSGVDMGLGFGSTVGIVVSNIQMKLVWGKFPFSREEIEELDQAFAGWRDIGRSNVHRGLEGWAG
jgi:hypothetical protein